jgi:hypothetical protein
MRIPKQLPPIPLKRSLMTPGPEKSVPSLSLRALGASFRPRAMCVVFY